MSHWSQPPQRLTVKRHDMHGVITVVNQQQHDTQQYAHNLQQILGQLTADTDAQMTAVERRRLRRGLADTQFVFCGYGSIARPIAERLCEAGARRFLLVDPKLYSQSSVASQCSADEVGDAKVQAGAKRLQKMGADVEAYTADVYWLPHGLIAQRSLIIASVDNRRGDIGANRLAAQMRSRLLKINIEPKFANISLRAYDFRRVPGICAECQFSPGHYETQRHPRSCDGDGVRSTNSPRWLSQAAGQIGAVAASDLAADVSWAHRWYAQQWQCWLDNGQQEISQLMPKAECRWEHRRRWKNLQRLDAGPQQLRLVDLLPAAYDAAAVRVRFCHDVALLAGCPTCGHRQPCLRWVSHIEQELSGCPHCQGNSQLRPLAYGVTDCLSLQQLQGVLMRPVADWGVAPQAVIEVRVGRKSQAFVVGRTHAETNTNPETFSAAKAPTVF